MKFEDFFQAYKVCALWASSDEHGNSFDEYDISDISIEANNDMMLYCFEFFNENYQLMLNASTDAEQHGHDFFLTHNGHGAGFWDRGYGKIGEQLTEAAYHYNEIYLYVANDGKIYME